MRYRYVIGILLSAGVLMAGVSCSPAPDEGQPENATQQQNAAQQKNAAEHGGAGNPGTSTAKGAIVGRTTVIGNVYSNPEIDMTCDPACAALNASAPAYGQRVLVDDNGNLANVVVWIKNVPEGDYPAKRDRLILDQVACRYVPHVLAIQLGQELRIRNSDAACHNVHFKSKLNGDWNVTQATKGTIRAKQELQRPEVGTALFKCDMHPWMECRVAVFDHPFFAVSARDGTFQIPTHNLPAGKYEVWAWHEKYKRLKLENVDLRPGERVPLTLTYK